MIEFSRTSEGSFGTDLKVVSWGAKGTDSTKYSYRVPNNITQTFRNFINSVVNHNNTLWSKRDALLILLDEFDVIRDKTGLGSLIKSLTSPTIKFAVCGIGSDLSSLVTDHASVGRLIQQGSLHVEPMEQSEVTEIFATARTLFKNQVEFAPAIVEEIANLCEGYPYFAQLIGKACVEQGNRAGTNVIDTKILESVLGEIRTGKVFPTLERDYNRAVGHSADRAWLLALLAEQSENETLFDISGNNVRLKDVRGIAKGLDVSHIDQNLPRLVEAQYGPVLVKDPARQGIYEFVDPVFRAYVKLRRIGQTE